MLQQLSSITVALSQLFFKATFTEKYNDQQRKKKHSNLPLIEIEIKTLMRS